MLLVAQVVQVQLVQKDKKVRQDQQVLVVKKDKKVK